MKYIARLAALAALVGVSANAAPFMAVGDGAELFVTASVTGQFDDNIYLDNTNEQDDTILSFTPGVDLVFGKGSATKGNAYYREEIRRYSDHDAQDTELSSLGFRSSTTSGNTKFDLNGSYAQVAQNDNDVRASGSLVRRKIGNLSGLGEFGLTSKTSLGLGATYLDTNYGPSTFSDSSVWSVPVDVYIKATAKLDWSVGYRYRDTALDGAGKDSQDHFVSIGGRGEFSPKLTGQVRVGYNQRSFDGGGDDDSFGLDASLTYAYSDKTSYRVYVNNDFGNSGLGESTKNFTWSASMTNRLTNQWYLTGAVNYRGTEYPTRSDDYFEGLVALAYTYNDYVNFSASYTYRNNDSDASFYQFSNSVLSFGANIRY
jgi:polysaccharide biosynthesis protein VpsM